MAHNAHRVHSGGFRVAAGAAGTLLLARISSVGAICCGSSSGSKIRLKMQNCHNPTRYQVFLRVARLLSFVGLNAVQDWRKKNLRTQKCAVDRTARDYVVRFYGVVWRRDPPSSSGIINFDEDFSLYQ